MTVRSEVGELTARIVADRWVGGDAQQAGWPERTWQALADAGLPWVGVDAARGGSGGSLVDACEVLWQVGAGAVPVPLAETGILAGWLLATAGAPVPSGPATITLAPDADRLLRHDGGWHLAARLPRVAWARYASTIVVACRFADQDRVALLRPGDVTVVPGHNLAGEPRDDVVVDGVVLDDDQVLPMPDGIDRATIRRRGALSRAALMAGAMERIAELTVAYSNDRVQFGKPVIAFQAVASMVVELVEHAVAAAMASRAAAAAGEDPELEIAIAKQQACEHGAAVAKLAHQVHGAMGMTAEYPLGDLTRRMWCWRQEYGTEREWAAWIGNHAVAAGADALWPRVTREGGP